MSVRAPRLLPHVCVLTQCEGLVCLRARREAGSRFSPECVCEMCVRRQSQPRVLVRALPGFVCSICQACLGQHPLPRPSAVRIQY